MSLNATDKSETRSGHHIKSDKRSPSMKVALSAFMGSSANSSTTSLHSHAHSSKNSGIASTYSNASLPVARRNSAHHFPVRKTSNSSSHSHNNNKTSQAPLNHPQLNNDSSADLGNTRRHSIAVFSPSPNGKSTNPFRQSSSSDSHSITLTPVHSPASTRPVSANTDSALLSKLGKTYLRDYLKARGLLEKKLIFTGDNIKISVADSGSTMFLASNPRRSDAYYARMNGYADSDAADDPYLSRNDTTLRNPASSASSGDRLNRSRASSSASGRQSINSRSNSSTDSDETVHPYNVAIIVTVKQSTQLKDIEANLFSRIRVFWKEGVPPTKSFKEEVYNYGSIKWTLNCKNYDLYIPCKVSSKDKIVNNNIKERKLEIFRNIPDKDRIYADASHSKEAIFDRLSKTETKKFHSGTYVFMLPVAFSDNVPESLYYPSARIGYRVSIATKIEKTKKDHLSSKDSHRLYSGTSTGSKDSLKEIGDIQPGVKHSSSTSLFKKVKSSLSIANDTVEHSKENHSANKIYVEYPLTIIRTPPPSSTTTANRSIYVNRTWSDALGYEISFGQKYIPLGSKVPIKLKISPLTKDIKLHRVRVNLLEKVSFVSKNYEYEFDQIDVISKDPYSPYYKNFQAMRRKCRSLSLLEIRTKEKGGHALREEIVENCFAGNLLAYDSIKDYSKKTDKERPEIGINEPIVIETNIEFPKFVDLDKKGTRNIPPYGVDSYVSVNSTDSDDVKQPLNKRHSSIRGFFTTAHSSTELKPEVNHTTDPRLLETKILTNSGKDIKLNTSVHMAKRGLYVDSYNCANISCKHKLEIMFRVSKKDDVNPTKIRNYEVVLDIPVIIVSDKCVVESMELPTYSMAIMDNPHSDLASTTKNAVDDVFPPSFEEVFSVPASPLGSPFASPTNSPRMRAMFSNDDLSDHLSLSKDVSSLNLNRTGEFVSTNPFHLNYSSNTDIASMVKSSQQFTTFDNLDDLLGSPKKDGIDENLVKSGDSDSLVAIDVPYCLYSPDKKKKLTINESQPEGLFKSDYSFKPKGSNHSLSGSDEIYHEVLGPDLKKSFTKSDPPTYDDIVSNR
ncbi:hypothetical protein TPHA_0E00640 [Tetrapisispora phaffii CBS 4417]|uniref:Arrestin C-terminal-like domain-containing protein n=1 Tax=Tetrapisispora phaffii (strain ATCC 24235 / CBS 4417 / NBRC 1672 / NRRL Y-8282 / UCD 70-5) TaxID=1071381 RepID=G8BTD1_TETPH|nr:hypothetical protein TPHA_0E00640 [Tetrapisispora phaffii CBS 4417]CCE63159.1 hypothetical protein TPHA_0E00640 [Tetrapisispora phaffii CBS 4417]